MEGKGDNGRPTTDDRAPGGVTAYVMDVETGARMEVRRSTVGVAKASGQVPVEEAHRGETGRPWMLPRFAASDLLTFYDENTWHRRCVGLKSTLTAGLGWKLVPERSFGVADGDGQAAPDVGHARLSSFFGRVNEEGETLVDVCVRAMTDLEAVGYAGIEVVRSYRGEVTELYHVPARTLRRAKDRRSFYQFVGEGRRVVKFAPYGAKRAPGWPAGRSELIWLSTYDPASDYYGAPEWLAALAALALDRQAVSYNLGLFRNGMMAATAVVVEGGALDEPGLQVVRDFFRDNATGAANAGRVLVLQQERDGAKVRVERLAVDTARDLGFVAGRAALRDEVVAAHGVPPRMVGILSAGQIGSTNEVQGQMELFLDAVIRPRQRMLASALAGVVAEVGGGMTDDGRGTTDDGGRREDERAAVGWRLRWQEPDATALRDDAEYFAKLVAAGVYTPEQAYAKLEGQTGA